MSAFYVSSQASKSEVIRVPVAFELVLKTLRYCTIKDKKEHRKSAVTKNEMMQSMIEQSIHNQLKFKYILADSWFASTDNMHFIDGKKKFFIFDLQNNRLAQLAEGQTKKPSDKSQWTSIKLLDIPNNTPVKVWLKDMNFPVLLTKQVFKDEATNITGVRFLVSNDFSLTDDQFTTTTGQQK